ncbi:MAG TPA: Glu/Leu/Phe/Val dehydrogenase dimerization domain-containing protein [Longimicrobiales bacterium]
MEQLLRDWNGESVVIRYDRPTDAWIFIAIHDRTLGMAMGGCRLKIYPSARDGLRDALRLAEGMTFKWAAIDFPFGGGKAVLAPARPLGPEEREGLLLRFGDLVESLGGAYGTGVDLGTAPVDMDVVGRRTSRVFGRSPEHGGAGDPGIYTALGVLAGIRAACAAVFDSTSLEGRRVLVQGVGGVGAPLARGLAEAGARVLVTDALPQRAIDVAGEVGAEVVAPESAYETACDIFSPCAIGGVLNARSIPRLRCRIVAGSANNQLEEEADAVRLHERGILYAPDFVVNAGGAIAHGALEMLGWSRDRVEARVKAIGETLAEIFADAERRAESPLPGAISRAERVLGAARRGTRDAAAG